ncbi:MAG TPA: hypothetical protein VG895_05215 [Patescibacteria group bacterium]|nr:hypothetical protein [Patescibacteria group bacterium]
MVTKERRYHPEALGSGIGLMVGSFERVIVNINLFGPLFFSGLIITATTFIIDGTRFVDSTKKVK